MKGIFYSTIALLLVTPLILFTFTNLHSYETSAQTMTTVLVGDKLGGYARSIESDLPRATSIMGTRAVTQAVIYVETNGTALTNASGILREIIENGTIAGMGTSTNFTVTSWTALLQQKGEQYGFNTTIRVSDIRFWQQDPYTVVVALSIAVNATYLPAAMELHRTYVAQHFIPITGFNDPLYTLATNGVLKQEIRQSIGTVNGSNAFDIAVTSGWYLPSQAGPGFLDRLEGRLVPSGAYGNSQNVTGLESVVFLPTLQASGISIKTNQTNIDHLYFGNANITGFGVNQSSYTWLRIDSAHAATYGLTLLP